ncbi:MAG: ABC transporter substrate-binding protein [Chloroherpetonaceae bacterium]|nr:ABC transporter substrate-binding protein [Chloroherpetonaceae bacterium]
MTFSSTIRILLFTFLTAFTFSCQPKSTFKKVGYVLFFEDATLQDAKTGFEAALKDGGFEEGKNLKFYYRNAQGDGTTQGQIFDFFLGEGVDLIATNPTVSTIAAVQRTQTIPVCMMVSPRPDLAKLTDANGKAPANLTGTYETLAYIDTSVTLIRTLFPNAKRIGTIYNSSEPNSLNSLERLRSFASSIGLELSARSVNNSNETQQASFALLSDNIDVFFALPDNIIFSSFETIYGVMTEAKKPILSSEAGLVSRGALAAYGADMYSWGYQAGQAAVKVLRGEPIPAPDEVKVRKRIFSIKSADALGVTLPADFQGM